jgi:peptidoglycan hydrolase CwlO-like protein
MRNNRYNPEGEGWSENGPHDRFLELCAVSTSGDLTEEEREDLRAHLADCAECRQALKEFEAAADIGMPLLYAHLAGSDSLESTSIPAETAKVMGATTTFQGRTVHTEKEPIESRNGLRLSHGNSHRCAQVNWNYVWMPFAAAMVLTAALVIYSYQFGKHKGQEVANTTVQPPDTRLEALEQRISDVGHEREVLRAQLAQRDGMIADLHRQVTEQSAVLAEVKNAQVDLEHSLQSTQAEKQEGTQERNKLSQKLDSLQASLQKTETELDSVRKQRSRDQAFTESLEAQISDLHGQLRDREQELGKQQDLLAHDRDIRELMGARDLYIAEVYDVARDGQTQKPYGRVFYTRGKSLVFYAYDLDQQAGYKNSSAFQAWGSHGLDKQQATSLGVFYEDNVAKKRWMVKFDDPKKLEQIDAVFVTVEPNGGSHKPSGKPLLFAYLKVDPNHP